MGNLEMCFMIVDKGDEMWKNYFRKLCMLQ